MPTPPSRTHSHVEALFTAPEAGAPMWGHDAVQALAGQGLAGDRYLLGTGKYSDRPHQDRHLTIIEAEVLEAVAEVHGIDLTPAECRRNLICRGLALNDLVGTHLRIGPVLVRAGRLNRPCRYLEELTGKAVLEPLKGRSGLNCEILEGGPIALGDPIVVVDGRD